jgi:prevent-host-death family protein
MPFEIVLAPEAAEDLKRLTAYAQNIVRTALETHLRHEPAKICRSRIKRLRGLHRPQYRLRVGEVRVFCDVSGTTVEVLAVVRQNGGSIVARTVRRSGVKEVPHSEIKDDWSHYLREAEKQEIVITRHGKPVGVSIGFESEEDWFDYRLDNDPRFLQRVERAHKSLRAGRAIRLEDLET